MSVVAFSGCRDYYAPSHVVECVFWEEDVTRVIVGDCPNGVDRAVRETAERLGIPRSVYEADWDQLGPAAGPERNRSMMRLGKPELLVAFWDGKSRGTLSAIREACKAGIPVKVYPVR